MQRALKPHCGCWHSHLRSSAESWREGKKGGRGKEGSVEEGAQDKP